MGNIIGYRGIGPERGKYVSVEDAFAYALDQCLHGTPEQQQEFSEMLPSWYFSGDFVEVEADED